MKGLSSFICGAIALLGALCTVVVGLVAYVPYGEMATAAIFVLGFMVTGSLSVIMNCLIRIAYR